MDFSQLHFARPYLLVGLFVIPFIWLGRYFFSNVDISIGHLEKFIDSHLLPHLLKNSHNEKKSRWKSLTLWSIVWSALILSLAGPRWSLHEIETFTSDQSLVILLDLSESMNATDVKPSRLIHAKQKIEDLINLPEDVKIGLVVFTADAHMVTPITDDKETILHFLPALSTDLMHVQGSRLLPAVKMAKEMLDAEPGTNKAILLVSDGGFEDASALAEIKQLTSEGSGIVIYTFGIGTRQGAPVKDSIGKIIKKGETPLLLKLDKEKLRAISELTHGYYIESDYTDFGEKTLLNDLKKRATAKENVSHTKTIWIEHFYLSALLALPFILHWFRQRSIFSYCLIFFCLSSSLHAESVWEDYFQNQEQQGKKAFDAEEFENAANLFQDPYRKGVAYYNAGNYLEAENQFRQSVREDVAESALYNLANALAMQQKVDEAIAVYEEIIEENPDHIKAKDNLEVVKKIKKNQQDQPGSNKEKNQKQDKNHKDKQQQGKSKNSNDGKNQSDDTDEGNDDGSSQSNDSNNEEKKQDNKNDTANDSEKDNEQDQTNNENLEQEHPSETKGNESEDKDSQETNEETSKEDSQKGSENVPETSDNDPKEESRASQSPKDASQEDTSNTPSEALKAAKDCDADLWLNRITNDQKTFLKNKFLIESKKNGTKAGAEPW